MHLYLVCLRRPVLIGTVLGTEHCCYCSEKCRTVDSLYRSHSSLLPPLHSPAAPSWEQIERYVTYLPATKNRFYLHIFFFCSYFVLPFLLKFICCPFFTQRGNCLVDTPLFTFLCCCLTINKFPFFGNNSLAINLILLLLSLCSRYKLFMSDTSNRSYS